VAFEALTFPQPPTLPNGNDGNQDYNLGYRFSAAEAVPCVGVRWVRTPDAITSTPNGGTHVAALWTVVGETRLRFANFVPVPASDNQDALFPEPYVLEPGTLYVVSIFSRDYVYRASGGVQTSSPSGTLVADEGKLSSSGDPTTFPASTQAAWYYISPLIDLGGDPVPAEGAGALGLNLAVTAAGARPSEGDATAGLGLAVAAAGATPARGVVALSLGLAVAAAGGRTARGAAALGLGLAVDASGTNGDNGRPVASFPDSPRPVTGWPWTPRPVRSFQEVES
jgi:uncharacterized protein DUF4082